MPSPYTFSAEARRFLKHMPPDTARRVFDTITALRNDPFPHDVKRVEGYNEKVFRVRVGDYRILYIIHNDPRSLDIITIDKRSRVYK